MRNKLTYQEKFKGEIDKIISQQRDTTVGKAQLTKLVNQWLKEVDRTTVKAAIKEVLDSVLCVPNFPEFAEWIIDRYICNLGAFWLENSSRKYGDTVLGWYSEFQVQAEELPLKLYRYNPILDDGDAPICKVLGWGLDWEKKGFYEAQELPYCWSNLQKFNYGDNPRYWSKQGYFLGNDIPLLGIDLVVNVPVEYLPVFAALGFASPCAIQWRWDVYPNNPLDSGYYVTRSIIPYGFWCAWKWWNTARDWYYEHRPELFEDSEIWGDPVPVRHDPPDPYAAVLGGKNKHKIITFSLDS